MTTTRFLIEYPDDLGARMDVYDDQGRHLGCAIPHPATGIPTLAIDRATFDRVRADIFRAKPGSVLSQAIPNVRFVDEAGQEHATPEEALHITDLQQADTDLQSLLMDLGNALTCPSAPLPILAAVKRLTQPSDNPAQPLPDVLADLCRRKGMKPAEITRTGKMDSQQAKEIVRLHPDRFRFHAGKIFVQKAS